MKHSFSDHNTINLEINCKKKAWKNLNTCIIKNRLLNNQFLHFSMKKSKRISKNALRQITMKHNVLKYVACSKRSSRREVPSNILEKRMAIHSSILAWKIPWTKEPGGLQSVGSQRVGHD